MNCQIIFKKVNMCNTQIYNLFKFLFSKSNLTYIFVILNLFVYLIIKTDSSSKNSN